MEEVYYKKFSNMREKTIANLDLIAKKFILFVVISDQMNVCLVKQISILLNLIDALKFIP